MRTISRPISIVPLLVLSILCFAFTSVSAQRNDSLVGKYRIVVHAGPKSPPAPTMFCILQKNGQYLWGADTKGKAQHPQVNSGSWMFTKGREIKLVPGPMSPMKETRFFAETSQGVFVFKSVEKEGRKTAVKNKELVLQLERVP